MGWRGGGVLWRWDGVERGCSEVEMGWGGEWVEREWGGEGVE